MTDEEADVLDLTGKVALVMGCGAVADGWGNGRATAVLLARLRGDAGQSADGGDTADAGDSGGATT